MPMPMSMPMSKHFPLLRLIAGLLVLSSVGPAWSLTAYEALVAHGLPVGLLPRSVVSFELDGPTGRFALRLERPCTAKFENEVRYERDVNGTLSYGHISSLSGVTAHELFLWFPVKDIRVDVPSSGLIYFDVGVIYKQFSLSLFDTPPDCPPTDAYIDIEEGIAERDVL